MQLTVVVVLAALVRILRDAILAQVRLGVADGVGESQLRVAEVARVVGEGGRGIGGVDGGVGGGVGDASVRLGGAGGQRDVGGAQLQ